MNDCRPVDLTSFAGRHQTWDTKLTDTETVLIGEPGPELFGSMVFTGVAEVIPAAEVERQQVQQDDSGEVQ